MDDAQLAVRTAVRAALRDRPLRVLVACSGGPDSIALLDATVWVGTREGFDVSTCIVDHGLQPGSAAVAERAAQLAAELGCADVHVVRVVVENTGDGIEASAREARRAALLECALQVHADAILLGHTLDDQAETVLLRLARGSGARSLAAMASADGPWRRPFLELPRSVVHAAAAALPTWADPQNEDPNFARVRVRRDALPALTTALGPGVVLSLARSAALLRHDADALEAWADSVPMVPGEPLDIAAIAELPVAVRTRVIRRWLGGGIEFDHVMAIERFISEWKGQGAVRLPGGVEVHRSCDRLITSSSSESS